MPRNFASRPRFNGKLVLLEDDTRLVRGPGVITLHDEFSVSSSTGTVSLPAAERVIDLTGVSEIRLQAYMYAYNPGILGFNTASTVTVVLEYQPIGGGTWTALVTGPQVTGSLSALQAISGWTTLPAAARADVRLRLRLLTPSGTAITSVGEYIELHTRADATLLGATGTSSGITAVGLHTVTAEVNFGFPAGGEDFIATTTVPVNWVASGAALFCTPAAMSSADHDPEDAAVEGISAYVSTIRAGVSFDIVATAPRGTWGRYKITVVG